MRCLLLQWVCLGGALRSQQVLLCAAFPWAAPLLQRARHGRSCCCSGSSTGRYASMRCLLLLWVCLVACCCSGSGRFCCCSGPCWSLSVAAGVSTTVPIAGLCGPREGHCCSGLPRSSAVAAGCPNPLLQWFGPPISFEDVRVRGPCSVRGTGGVPGDLHSPDGPRHSPYSGNQPGCGRGPDARGIAHTRSRGWIAPLGMTACVRASPSAAHYWGRPVFERQPMTGCPGDSGQRDNLASSSSRLPYTLRGDLRRAGGRLGVLPLTLVCRPHG